MLSFLAILSVSVLILTARLSPFLPKNLIVFAILSILSAAALLIGIAILVSRHPSPRLANEQRLAPTLSRKKGGGTRASRVSHTRFKRLVQEALGTLPEAFSEQMENVVILVERQPREQTVARVGVKQGRILLGLYQGVPLTAQGYQRALLPARITLYQNNIEAYCHGDPARIHEQVRKTLLHEIAHHFGIDHEEMPIWVR